MNRACSILVVMAVAAGCGTSESASGSATSSAAATSGGLVTQVSEPGLNVKLAIVGAGRVASTPLETGQPPFIDCTGPGACAPKTFVSGSPDFVLTLTATPSTGDAFVAWTFAPGEAATFVTGVDQSSCTFTYTTSTAPQNADPMNPVLPLMVDGVDAMASCTPPHDFTSIRVPIAYSLTATFGTP